MNVLTADSLTTIAFAVHPDMTLHSTAVSYLQHLLRPYAEAIEGAQVAGLKQWVPQALPGQIAVHAQEEMDKAISAKLKDLNAADPEPKYTEESPEVAPVAVDSVIDYLAAELIEVGGNNARGNWSHPIWAWDILNAIYNNADFTQLFGVTDVSGKLPIVVNVAGVEYNHDVTLELLGGLLLYLHPSVSGSRITVSFLGTPVSSTDVITVKDENTFPSRFEDIPEFPRIYTVVVKGSSYGFNMSDFMQGFSSGAYWDNVDHHNYWEKLYQRSGDGQLVEITF